MGYILTAIASGFWSDENTWDLGGPYPETGDTAIIPSGFTPVITYPWDTCAVLDVQAGGGLSLGTWNNLNLETSGTIAGTLTGGGNIVLGGSLAFASTAVVSGWTGQVQANQTAGNPTLTTAGKTFNLSVSNGAATSFTITDAFALGTVEMSGAGSKLTLPNGVACSMASYTQTEASTLVDGNAATTISVAGNISIMTGATLTSLATWTQTASGTVRNTGAVGSAFAHLRVGMGVTSTLAATTACKKLTIGDGAFSLVDKDLTIIAGANDFLVSASGKGTSTTGRIVVDSSGGTDLTQGAFWVGCETLFSIANGKKVTATGAWRSTALTIRGNANNALATVDMGSAGTLTTGAITLGHDTSATRAGSIHFRNQLHSIGGLAAATGVSTSSVNFGSAVIVNSGIIDGANLTCNGAYAHVFGGTVRNVTMTTGKLYCHGCTDGGGNDANVIFLSPQPGSRSLLGMGI